MPADPFREGHYDWTNFAAGDQAFFTAHVAAGMPETVALELTKTYMMYMLGILLSAEVQQPGLPEGETPA